jgi:hypothetical protein
LLRKKILEDRIANKLKKNRNNNKKGNISIKTGKELGLVEKKIIDNKIIEISNCK